MQLIITDADLIKLKPETRADIISSLFPQQVPPKSSDLFGLVWEDRVDLNPQQVEVFMPGCSDTTIAGLRIVAEHGPLIHASLLKNAGIDNFGHFQGRVTQRTRTVTGDKHAFLFTWDDWNSVENKGVGHYAVTEVTYRSLRKYFNLD